MNKSIVKFALTHTIEATEENYMLKNFFKYFSGFITDQFERIDIDKKVEYIKLNQGLKNVMNLHYRTSVNVSGIEMNPLTIPGLIDVHNLKTFKQNGEILLSNFTFEPLNKEIAIDLVFQSEELGYIDFFNGKFLLSEAKNGIQNENEIMTTFCIQDIDKLSIISFQKI